MNSTVRDQILRSIRLRQEKQTYSDRLRRIQLREEEERKKIWLDIQYEREGYIDQQVEIRKDLFTLDNTIKAIDQQAEIRKQLNKRDKVYD